MTRDQFSSALAREPKHIQKIGRSIVKNLAIIEGNTHCEEDKAAAKEALRGNLKRFRKARAG